MLKSSDQLFPTGLSTNPYWINDCLHEIPYLSELDNSVMAPDKPDSMLTCRIDVGAYHGVYCVMVEVPSTYQSIVSPYLHAFKFYSVFEKLTDYFVYITVVNSHLLLDGNTGTKYQCFGLSNGSGDGDLGTIAHHHQIRFGRHESEAPFNSA